MGKNKETKKQQIKKHHLLLFDLWARAEAFGRYSAVCKREFLASSGWRMSMRI